MQHLETQSVELTIAAAWRRAKDLLGLIRFSHTVFALPFALLAAVLAWREVSFRSNHLVGIVLCMVFARSAAMAFNRILDRDIDAANPRTEGRHIPAGILSLRLVSAFTIVCLIGFVLSTLLFWPNYWPLVLALPVLAFLMGYSYAKRLTALCHYWLSAALMLSPIAAWIALTGTLSWIPVLLALVIFFWVGGFDILYATQDASFDREQKLHSIPAKVGLKQSLRIAFMSHLITSVCLFGLWHVAHLGTIFLIGVILVSGLLAYEHWIISPGDLTRVNVAFFNINALISIGLLLLTILDVVLSAYLETSENVVVFL